MRGIIVKEREKSDASIARYSKGNKKFEILVDCEAAMKLKEGQNVDIASVLTVPEIFTDSRKAERVPRNELLDVFGTDNVYEVAKQIVKNGHIEVTKEYREAERDKKLKQIISRISREGVDPRSGLPLPPKRIELAIEQAGVKIDDYRSADDQFKEVVEKLRAILPISFEHFVYEVQIPASFVGLGYSLVTKYGNLKKQEWLPNGSFKGIVEISSGSNADFLDGLSKATKGTVYVKRMEE